MSSCLLSCFSTSLFYGLPVVALSNVVYLPFGVVDLPPGVVATALACPLLIVVGVVVVAALDPVVVIAFVVANLGHPKFVASPNAYYFPSPSSSVQLVGEIFVGGSIDALSNDAPCSHSSSLSVSMHKKMERSYSGSNLNYSSASDTIALPTDATTNHCRKRCPHLSQGQHRHSSQVSLLPLEVRQIR